MVIKFVLLVALIIGALLTLHFLRVIGSRPPRPVRGRGPRSQARVEETERCRICGTYVSAKSARACGRPDCPYPPRAGAGG